MSGQSRPDAATVSGAIYSFRNIVVLTTRALGGVHRAPALIRSFGANEFHRPIRLPRLTSIGGERLRPSG